MGIKDNERADKEAKAAINDEPIINHPIPASDVKNLIKQKTKQK